MKMAGTGTIDDVRIYSRALSAEEVAVLAGGNSAYDGLNRRIVHAERDYYYNTSWQTLEVRTNGVANPLKQYVWDLRYIDAPVLRWRDENTDGTVDDTLYSLNDANMNITAVVDGSDGDVVERYAYDPYGQVTVLNGEDDADGGVSEWSADADNVSDWDNRIGYCGYRLDPETGANGQGIMHVRRRPYHCTLARWTSRDPLNQDEPAGGYHDGMGLYQYGRSRPGGAVDPTGLVVVFFGGGFGVYDLLDIEGLDFTTGNLFSPPAFAFEVIDRRLLGEPAKTFSGVERGESLAAAKQWLKATIRREKKEKHGCTEGIDIKIAAYSSGNALALRLAQAIKRGEMKADGVLPEMLIRIAFYDFNWGSAALGDYNAPLNGDFTVPADPDLEVYHVVSAATVLFDGWFRPMSEVTENIWQDVGELDTLFDIETDHLLKYGLYLANSTGENTWQHIAEPRLKPTARRPLADHFGLGILMNVFYLRDMLNGDKVATSN